MFTVVDCAFGVQPVVLLNAPAAEGSDVLSKDSVDSILEANVTRIGLFGNPTPNAALKLGMVVKVRLLRREDGKVIHSMTINKKSKPRTAPDWAKNEALVFTVTAEQMYVDIANEIIATLFGMNKLRAP